MFKASVKVAKVWGIPIRLHISLVIVVLVLMKALRMEWYEALLFEIAFATTIALHELAHSIVAIRKGCRVHQITLLALGGVAQMEQIPTKPRDEFMMAIAGPALSLILGGLLIALALFGLPLPHFLRAHAGTLGGINVGLALFNLLPAFPMDGGRVLRALLSTRMPRLKATLIASRMGQIVSILMVLLALWWHAWILAAIFVFIFFAAGNEYKTERLRTMARAAGFGFWGPGAGIEDENPDENEVVVGPAPYESSRGTRTEIRPDSRSPFRRFFGR